MSSDTDGNDCGIKDGGGMESAALMTGEVDEENAAFPALAANDDVFACCAFVNCSKRDCVESNSKDKAGSLTALVVASWPIFSLLRSRSSASKKSLSCGTLYQ